MTMLRPEPMQRTPAPVSRETVEEQARRRGIQPVLFLQDMVCLDAFESDEEVDEFIAFVYAQRRASQA
jgi:hypothetical protein